jgi:hypothetical protein
VLGSGDTPAGVVLGPPGFSPVGRGFLGLQVSGIDTTANLTPVVDVMTIRNRTDEEREREPVGVDSSTRLTALVNRHRDVSALDPAADAPLHEQAVGAIGQGVWGWFGICEQSLS